MYRKETRGKELSTYSTKKKVNCLDHISRRNSTLKQVINGKIEGETEVKGRRGRRRRQILNDIEGM
jgi:hypothetical protein